MFVVFAAGGCSLGPVKTELRYNPNVVFIDPTSGPVLISSSSNGQTFIHKTRNSSVDAPSCVKVDYLKLPFAVSSLPAMKCQLPNGKTYDLFIDTGFSEYYWMNELVVKENDLAIYPITPTSSETQAGICYLPWLKFGDATIVNPPARYQQLHWEFRLLGVPLWQQKTLLMGLKSVLEFDHVIFDNKAGFVQFCSKSGKSGFEPPADEHWASYKYTIEPDASDNIRMMVEMPVAGQNRKVMFDTCGGYGLLVHPAVWRKMSKELGRPNFSKGTFITGFQGFLPCLKGDVDSLRLGDRIFKNANIVVPDETTTYLGAVEVVLGMAYYKDSVMVIDNANKLLWIKG